MLYRAHCLKIPNFPGGAVDRNPPANAGDMRLIPDLGRLHMPWSSQAPVPKLERLCSRAYEPELLNPPHLGPVLCNRGSHHNEKPVHCDKEQPRSLQLEKSSCSSEDPVQLNINKYQRSEKVKEIIIIFSCQVFKFNLKLKVTHCASMYSVHHKSVTQLQ